MLQDLNLYKLFLMLVPLIFSVTVHEVAHGYVAYRLGDHTAKIAGRLTLNPIKHLDFFGSLLLPAMLKFMGSPIIFGYAKPVPVNFANLRDYRTGTILVSSAGVISNLAVAVVSGALFQLLTQNGNISYAPPVSSMISDLSYMLYYSVIINCVLAVFNLIPIPPLDGSRILGMFLPQDLRVKYSRLERFGMAIIIILLLTGFIQKIIRYLTVPLVGFLLGG
jgi:Zn-dependent protease